MGSMFSRSTFCTVMAQLTEETQPCFETTIKSKAVSEACNVKFSCVVTGHPVPELTWYKDDMELDRYCGLPKYEIFRNGKTHTLHIYNCTVDDAAIYQASARNGKGIVSCSGVLEVGTMNEYKIHQRFFAKLKQKAELKRREQEEIRRQEEEKLQEESLSFNQDHSLRKRRFSEGLELNSLSALYGGESEDTQEAIAEEQTALFDEEYNGLSVETHRLSSDLSENKDRLQLNYVHEKAETGGTAQVTNEEVSRKKNRISNGFEDAVTNQPSQVTAEEEDSHKGISLTEYLSKSFQSQTSEEQQKGLAPLQEIKCSDTSTIQEKERDRGKEIEKEWMKTVERKKEQERCQEREQEKVAQLEPEHSVAAVSEAKAPAPREADQADHLQKSAFSSVFHSLKGMLFGKSKKSPETTKKVSDVNGEKEIPLHVPEARPRLPQTQPQEPGVCVVGSQQLVPMEVDELNQRSELSVNGESPQKTPASSHLKTEIVGLNLKNDSNGFTTENISITSGRHPEKASVANEKTDTVEVASKSDLSLNDRDQEGDIDFQGVSMLALGVSQQVFPLQDSVVENDLRQNKNSIPALVVEGQGSAPAISSDGSEKKGDESGGSTPTSALSCESSPKMKRRDSLTLIPSATPEELASGARRKIYLAKTKSEDEGSDTQSRRDSPYMSPSQARRAAFLQLQSGQQTPPMERRSPLLGRRKATLEVPKSKEEMSEEPNSTTPESKPAEKEKLDPFKAPQVIRKIRGEAFSDASGHLKLWCQFFNVLSDSTIKWFRDETEIVEIKRNAGDESQVALAIVQASNRDCGVYGCTIKNEYGSDTTDYLLSTDILAEFFLRDDLEVGEEIEMMPLLFTKGLADSSYWGEKFFGRIMTEEVQLGQGCMHKTSRAKVIYGLDPIFESGSTCIAKVRNPIAYGTKEENNLAEKNLEATKQECKIQNMIREYCKIFAAEARVIENFGFSLEVIPLYLMSRPANTIPYATVEADLKGTYLTYCLMDNTGSLVTQSTSELEQKCCTFQHWIHQWTNGNLLVTRLEGVDTKITNIRIATKSKGYQGLTDEGSLKILEQFATQHQCNYYCGLLGLRPLKPMDPQQQPKVKTSRSPLLARRPGPGSASPQLQKKGSGSPQLQKKGSGSPQVARKELTGWPKGSSH
uniref:non-specific serine/threonine protein kinase n=1 Tax=Electrophorus electricus TaxID=8005 RepID=A0AAY5EE06_ELEEL